MKTTYRVIQVGAFPPAWEAQVRENGKWRQLMLKLNPTFETRECALLEIRLHVIDTNLTCGKETADE